MTLLLCLAGGVWSLSCVLAGYFLGVSENENVEVDEQEYKLRRVK